MTPREHLKASLRHFKKLDSSSEDWVKMPGFKFARNWPDGVKITETTKALLKMSDEELNEAWTRWVIEEET